MGFKLKAPYPPAGGQPKAISELVKGFLEEGVREQVLLGITGSGKTFTVANVIAALDLPTLVLSPNKTLAAQLFAELKSLFPENSVNYFVSHYDYYQPEAYIPHLDLYIEKDTDTNEKIERLRHKATTALLTRRDVIIVATVSSIYGLGAPEVYKRLLLTLRVGQRITRDQIINKLITMLYERTKGELKYVNFRVRGNVVDVMPAHMEEVVRIEVDEKVERIAVLEPTTFNLLYEPEEITISPASHYMTERDMAEVVKEIRAELEERVKELERRGKVVEARRLRERTLYDIEMMLTTGTCKGIENYSRFLTGRPPGTPPPCLFDFFPPEFLTVVDESHLTIPQVRGMYAGDRSRKETLVKYGFRLPSALDNRPLRFEEWVGKLNRVIYMSATPGEYELNRADKVVELIIRPTGLLDPKVRVESTENLGGKVLKMCKEEIEKGGKLLVLTLTKKTAESLYAYLVEHGIRAKYLHSEIHNIERAKILDSMREGRTDVIVGINLLREGIDLPMVTKVLILDADKPGFLRSKTSLIQIIGRAARNSAGEVIFFADETTEAMKEAISETERRRRIQEEFNKKHGITPQTTFSARHQIVEDFAEELGEEDLVEKYKKALQRAKGKKRRELLERLREEMMKLAEELRFEEAAELRDIIIGEEGKI